MTRSLRLVLLWDIDVRIHVIFILILAWAAYFWSRGIGRDQQGPPHRPGRPSRRRSHHEGNHAGRSTQGEVVTVASEEPLFESQRRIAVAPIRTVPV